MISLRTHSVNCLSFGNLPMLMLCIFNDINCNEKDQNSTRFGIEPLMDMARLNLAFASLRFFKDIVPNPTSDCIKRGFIPQTNHCYYLT